MIFIIYNFIVKQFIFRDNLIFITNKEEIKRKGINLFIFIKFL